MACPKTVLPSSPQFRNHYLPRTSFSSFHMDEVCRKNNKNTNPTPINHELFTKEISLPLSLKKITVFNLKGEKKITSLVDVNEEIGVEKQKKIAENQETMVFVEEEHSKESASFVNREKRPKFKKSSHRRKSSLPDQNNTLESNLNESKLTKNDASTMTEHSAPLLTIAKPNQSRTIVLQPSNTSETHCDQSPLKVDSKCSFVNICNPLQNESKHLHNLPTPSQSCTMAAISMRNSPRLREYCDILQNDRRRGTEGQRALVKLRQLRASRTSSDLYFDAHEGQTIQNTSKPILVLVSLSCFLFFALLATITFIHLDAVTQFMPEMIHKYIATRFSPLIVDVEPKPVPTITEQYWNNSLEFADKIWRILGHIYQNVLRF